MNISDMKATIKSMISSKRGRRTIRNTKGGVCKKNRRRVLSVRKYDQETLQMYDHESKQITDVHNMIIHHVNEKLRFKKLVNGRFFSPQVLRQKASTFQRHSDFEARV
ncbi:unnamed protein product [Moneuplotes crassus]|uniref:Uncharacterized protein n=1 Tax=Euplotes crassus TaxID=5936 RepID=A0AAD1Y1R3_EUPCR|nr:unnamed protein product [Moneuplotes crassus]